MALDDALLLVAKDFNEYLCGLRSGTELPSLNFLLHLLADGRHLSAVEINRIVQHLQSRIPNNSSFY